MGHQAAEVPGVLALDELAVAAAHPGHAADVERAARGGDAQPLAGVGAAVIGAFTTFVSVGSGAIIGHAYQGTILPLVIGFAILGVCSLGVTRWAEKGRGSDTR